jgi:hypothetical protein
MRVRVGIILYNHFPDSAADTSGILTPQYIMPCESLEAPEVVSWRHARFSSLRAPVRHANIIGTDGGV